MDDDEEDLYQTGDEEPQAGRLGLSNEDDEESQDEEDDVEEDEEDDDEEEDDDQPLASSSRRPGLPSSQTSDAGSEADTSARAHSGLDMLRAIRQIRSLALPQTERLGDLDDLIHAANLSRNKRQKGRLGRRRLDEVPPHLTPLVGEANLAYIMRDFSKAVRLLSEVIRQAPTVPSSYSTIGLIFEESGDIARALQYYLIAAHLSRGDSELWRRTGQLSEQLELPEQAIYCFSKALQSDPRDTEILHRRSQLYVKQGDTKRATDGFRELLVLLPNNLEAARALANLYKANDEVSQAIDSFMPVVRHHVAALSGPHAVQRYNAAHAPEARVSMDDLLLLADLLLLQPDHEAVVTIISDATLELCAATRAPAPPALQAKIGIAHVALGNVADAQIALAPLFSTDPQTGSNGDAFMDVGETFVHAGRWQDALTWFARLDAHPSLDGPRLWLSKAQCHARMHELERAADLYSRVLEREPHRMQVRITLARLFEALGTHSRALEVLQSDAVPPPAQQPAEPPAAAAPEAAPAPKPALHLAPLIDFSRDQPPPPGTLSAVASARRLAMGGAAEEEGRKRRRTASTSTTWVSSTASPGAPRSHMRLNKVAIETASQRMLTQYQRCMLLGTRATDANAFGSAVRDLLGQLDTMESLVLPGRGRGSTAAASTKRRRLDAAASSSAGGPSGDDGVGNADDLLGEDVVFQLHGIALGPSPDQWLALLVRYLGALVGSPHGQAQWDAAIEACNVLDASALFHHDPNFRQHVQLLLLALSTSRRSYGVAISSARWFCTRLSTSSHIYNFLLLATSSGPEAASALSSSNVVKYVHRLVKLHPENAFLLTISGHQMLASRTFGLAGAYYLKALELHPNSALLHLCLGVVSLLRSMQRLSHNRHAQIAEAFAFFYQYRELRGETQEALYNMGRAFQHLGLHNFAEPCYRRALELSPTVGQQGVALEAAYNLHLLYVHVGMPQLADQVLQEYLTV